MLGSYLIVPQTRIKLTSPALEAWGLNHWTIRDIPWWSLKRRFMQHIEEDKRGGRVCVAQVGASYAPSVLTSALHHRPRTPEST